MEHDHKPVKAGPASTFSNPLWRWLFSFSAIMFVISITTLLRRPVLFETGDEWKTVLYIAVTVLWLDISVWSITRWIQQETGRIRRINGNKTHQKVAEAPLRSQREAGATAPSDLWTSRPMDLPPLDTSPAALQRREQK